MNSRTEYAQRCDEHGEQAVDPFDGLAVVVDQQPGLGEDECVEIVVARTQLPESESVGGQRTDPWPAGTLSAWF
jgi:hypothetical protein